MLLVGNLKVLLNLNYFHYMVFSYLTKYFGCKIEIQSNSTILGEEQNNYTTKTVNASIAYDLHISFTLKIAYLKWII